MSPDECRLVVAIGALGLPTGHPSFTHEGIGIDIPLDVVDPLPFLEECLLREACKLGCPLGGDVPRLYEQMETGNSEYLEGEGDDAP
jgi:hypothetical protein